MRLKCLLGHRWQYESGWLGQIMRRCKNCGKGESYSRFGWVRRRHLEPIDPQIDKFCGYKP